MSFSEFVEAQGKSMSDSRVTLSFVAMKYAKHLRLPNVCTISSNVFTHGDLIFDPAEKFNQRFYSDPKSIVQIVPAVAERSGYRHTSSWFDRNREGDLMAMLGQCVHAWLIF